MTLLLGLLRITQHDQHKPVSLFPVYFSVHTSLGKFLLTVCNYLLLSLLLLLLIIMWGCSYTVVIIINSKLRLVSAN